MQPEELKLSVESFRDLPKKTGVYIFEGERQVEASADEAAHDRIGPRVLYVGKAKSLNARVKQYFLDQDDRPFVKFIRSKTRFIRYVVVETEQDALILENEFIKKYRPSYNISLKDDKRYLSLRLDLKHEWPRIEVVRRIQKDQAVYLGPFSSSTRLRATLDFMQKIFLLRTCNDHKLYNRSRPCIEYEVKRCSAPCVSYITRDEYAEIVSGAVRFLNGQTADIVDALKLRMQTAVEAEAYERAAEFRDQIDALEKTTQAQSIVGLQQIQSGLDQDAIGYFEKDLRGVVSVLFVRAGIVFDHRVFEIKPAGRDAKAVLEEFIDRYYGGDVYMPKEILVSHDVSRDNLFVQAKVIQPRTEEKLRFVRLADENAKIYLEQKIEKLKKLSSSLERVKALLDLNALPELMDCIDISHHQGSETVASVVRFKDGEPLKSGYRKIKLKVDRVDDFASMREAVARRYKAKEDLPSLLVIDGGPGQLSSAHQALTEIGLRDFVELVSLAKAREHEGIDPLNPQNRERVFKVGQKNPILLRQNSQEELLLRHIRDEAHRFAIRFHRDRKSKTLSASMLDQIEGMTTRLKIKLLRTFGSIEGISDASDFDLLAVVNESVLIKLRERLRQNPAE